MKISLKVTKSQRTAELYYRDFRSSGWSASGTTENDDKIFPEAVALSSSNMNTREDLLRKARATWATKTSETLRKEAVSGRQSKGDG